MVVECDVFARGKRGGVEIADVAAAAAGSLEEVEVVSTRGCDALFY